MSSQVRRVLCAGAALGLALAGCGGGDGVSRPSERPGTGLPAPSTPAAPTAASESEAARPTLPTVALPSVTRPSVTLPPVAPSTAVPTRSAVAPPAATTPALPATTVPPAPPTATTAPTAAATTTAPDRTSAASTPAPTPTPAAVPVAPSPSPPAWVWWLLGLLIALVTAGLVLLAVRGRRATKAWEARLAGAVAESTWLAHQLLPYALSSGMAAGRRDVWAAYRPRVRTLVSNLGAVTASASKDRMPTVDRLRAAVTDVSSAMDAYASAGPQDRETIGAARQAQRQLEEVLRLFQPPAPPTGPPPPTGPGPTAPGPAPGRPPTAGAPPTGP